MPAFNTLIAHLGAAKRGTFEAGYNYMLEMLGAARDLLTEHVKTNPGDRHAAKSVMEDIRSLSLAPRQTELGGIEDAMQQIVAGFKQGSEEYLKKTKALTSEIMRSITGTLRTQMNNPMKLRGITPEMMADAVMSALVKLEMTSEQRVALRAAILPLFTKPDDLAIQMSKGNGEKA